MTLYEAWYGRHYRLFIHWAELQESLLLRHELVRQTTGKVAEIRESILTVHSHQKSYADQRQRSLEF